MIIIWLISLVLCADPLPSINPSLIRGYFPWDSTPNNQCGINQIFNTFIFSCEEKNDTNYGGDLYRINSSNIIDVATICDNTETQVFNVCVPNATTITASTLCDIYTNDYKDQCNNILKLYYASSAAGNIHPLALQFLANLAALEDYPITTQNPIIQDWMTIVGANTRSIMGYQFWLPGIPFFKYLDQRGVTLGNILDENYITSRFNFADVTQFYLARYSWDGNFIGFTPLTLQLNQCGQKNDISQIWRNYGTNYITDCYFDLPTFSREAGNEFYELFLGDGSDSNGNIIMRPIPVMINGNGNPVRRFYRLNNQTAQTKYIDATYIQFNIYDSDTSTTRTPYFTFNIASVPTTNLDQLNDDVKFNSPSPSHPLYKFEVKYQMSTGNFNQVFMILSIVMGVLAFIIMIARIFFVALVDGKYGLNGIAFAKILVAVFDTCGLYFFILTFAFAAFVLVFFKFQKAVFWCLPEESFKVFKLMKSFLISSLAFEIASGLLSVFVLPMNNNFFIMDWESSQSKKAPVSAWRRINVANELNRISTIRSYNMAFTVIVVAFILTGFDVELLSTPIPSPRLISTGYSHWVLRYASSAIIWLLVMLIQYMFYNFLYWRFYGNPFFNFLDLCTTSNLSLFVFTSPSHGYYLHGRSVQSHSDVEMKNLAQALIDEEEGIVGLRGLLPNTTEQVFEVFFSREFSQIATSNLQRIEMSRVPSGVGKVTAKDFSNDSFAAYGEMNLFLKKFIDGSDENKYIVQPPELLQIIFQVPPQIMNDSIMNKVSDSYYKVSLISGSEWPLMIMYLLLFCVMDMTTKSPSIAAFVVYIIDGFIKRIFARIFRIRLAKSSLLDGRFLLS